MIKSPCPEIQGGSKFLWTSWLPVGVTDRKQVCVCACGTNFTEKIQKTLLFGNILFRKIIYWIFVLSETRKIPVSFVLTMSNVHSLANFRQFRIKCGKCSISLYSDDLVMRTSTSIFHYSCFSCSICGTALQQGDEYKVRSSQIVCSSHFNKIATNVVETISSAVQGKTSLVKGVMKRVVYIQ